MVLVIGNNSLDINVFEICFKIYYFLEEKNLVSMYIFKKN